MHHRRQGITLTELLTVVSVIAILTSIMSPFVIRSKQAAVGTVCKSNIAQIYTGINLVANDRYGRLPECFELYGNGVKGTLHNVTVDGKERVYHNADDSTWWYRKVGRVLYPDANHEVEESRTIKIDEVDHTVNVTVTKEYLSQQRVQCPECGVIFWTSAGGGEFINCPRTECDGRFAPTGGFRSNRCVLRCPASIDPYPQSDPDSPAPEYHKQAEGVIKDRVFDDCYGYNNSGFTYAGHEDEHATIIPIKSGQIDYNSVMWGRMYTSKYYHGGGWGAITGSRTEYDWYDDDGNAITCSYVGGSSKVVDAARTILLMDYIKADVAPRLENDNVFAYRFRHGGRANVLFVDGHQRSYSEETFLADIGTDDPITKRSRIHWNVIKP